MHVVVTVKLAVNETREASGSELVSHPLRPGRKRSGLRGSGPRLNLQERMRYAKAKKKMAVAGDVALIEVRKLPYHPPKETSHKTKTGKFNGRFVRKGRAR